MRAVATNLASHFGTGLGLKGHAIALVRLSKIADYLVDNASSDRLSDLEGAVNDKARWGAESADCEVGTLKE